MKETAPKGFRLHLGLFGRRNVGKSSLLNALTRQTVSIVSDVAGTTTDPVEKPMELLPIGPVLFIDTAGLDDVGALGELRIEKTRQAIDRTDIALLVLDLSRGLSGEKIWGEFEEELTSEFARRQIPVLVVLNKSDIAPVPTDLNDFLTKRNLPFVAVANRSETIRRSDGRPVDGTGALRDLLVTLLPDDFISPPPIVSDLLPPGEMAILVTPIDKEAPKGRLIIPQVQTIRDLLDGGRGATVVQVDLLAEALKRLNPPPKLVVTDSQAFEEVAAIVPPTIPLTSFSILFARQKGDLAAMAAGAAHIGSLGPKAKILIAEACSHHPIEEDIGTEKIPRWLRAKLGDAVEIGHTQGHHFPATDEELARWDLVIHCGACVWNRRETLRRVARCAAVGVPITNYGLAIAYLNGILDRVLSPFAKG